MYHIREGGVPLHACDWYMKYIRDALKASTSIADFITIIEDSYQVEHNDKDSAENIIKKLSLAYPEGDFTIEDGVCPYISQSLKAIEEIEAYEDNGDTSNPVIH